MTRTSLVQPSLLSITSFAIAVLVFLLSCTETGEEENTGANASTPNSVAAPSSAAMSDFLKSGSGAIPASAIPASALPASFSSASIPPRASMQTGDGAIPASALPASFFFAQSSFCGMDLTGFLKIMVMVVDLPMAQPAAVLDEARKVEPKKDGNTATWEASSADKEEGVDVTYTLRLTGIAADNITFTNGKHPQGTQASGFIWALSVSMKGTVAGTAYNVTDFVFFNGVSNTANTMGAWEVFDIEEANKGTKGVPRYSVNWYKLSDTDRGVDFKITSALLKDSKGVSNQGDQISYSISGGNKTVYYLQPNANDASYFAGTSAGDFRYVSKDTPEDKGSDLCIDANKCVVEGSACTVPAPNASLVPMPTKESADSDSSNTDFDDNSSSSSYDNYNYGDTSSDNTSSYDPYPTDDTSSTYDPYDTGSNTSDDTGADLVSDGDASDDFSNDLFNDL